MKHAHIFALLASVGVGAIMTAPVSAQSINDLQQQMIEMQKQIDALKASEKKTSIIKKAEPAFALGTKDGLFEFNIRGRLYADYIKVSDEDGTMDMSGTEFRTARLGIEGKAWKDVKYKFEADFAGNEVTVKDAYMQVSTGVGKVTVGQFKTSNSLDEQTSSRHISFMERGSFTDAFGFARQMGIALSNGGDNWTAKAGIFKGSNSDSGEGDLTLAARATYGGEIDNGKWLLGASMRNRNTDGQLRYRQRPHVHMSDRFVNTGHIGNGNDFFYGAEAGFQLGSFHGAAEYGFLNAKDAGTNGGNANFGGGYAEVGYFLTGESRTLKLDKGAWDRPKVNNPVNEGGMGAVSVNARFDTLDLSDNGIAGGKQDTWILGINWYLNRHTRVMANYSHSNISDAYDVAANGIDGKNSVNALAFRFQVDW